MVMPHSDAGRPWTLGDDAALISELGRGRPAEAIAAALQRSAADVRARLDALAEAATDTRSNRQNRIFPRDIAAS
jgi:hypothetical protein